jgi:peptide-methionine (S)-S-oxide reductase
MKTMRTIFGMIAGLGFSGTAMMAADGVASGGVGARERLTLGGGCFWCVEAVYQRIEGVTKVVSGYAGGHVPNPTYEQVCEKTTGHAEVVQIEFDSSKVKVEHLLEVFWVAHDPTTLNRQGADRGPQYRSIILFENEAQKAAAEASKAKAQKEIFQPIVTEIVKLEKFYAAEGYHQNYFNQNAARNPYCAAVIEPKVRKLVEKGVISRKPLIGVEGGAK